MNYDRKIFEFHQKVCGCGMIGVYHIGLYFQVENVLSGKKTLKKLTPTDVIKFYQK